MARFATAPKSEGPRGSKHGADRRRGSRKETCNHRLVRRLREPLVGAGPGSAAALPLPGFESGRLSWGSVVASTLLLWTLAALMVILP